MKNILIIAITCFIGNASFAEIVPCGIYDTVRTNCPIPKLDGDKPFDYVRAETKNPRLRAVQVLPSAAVDARLPASHRGQAVAKDGKDGANEPAYNKNINR